MNFLVFYLKYTVDDFRVSKSQVFALLKEPGVTSMAVPSIGLENPPNNFNMLQTKDSKLGDIYIGGNVST